MKKQLIARRLIQMKDIDSESCFYIHRSLARSIRDELLHDHVRQQNVFNQALTLVQNIFPSPSPIQVPEPEKWSDHQQLLPHVLSLRSAFYEANPNIEGSERFARLLSDAGINQWERGITKEGLVILKTAEDVLNSISFDNYDGMRANIHTIVALMYDNTGISSRAEGERRRREALKLRSYRAEQSSQVSINDETLLYNARMDYVISLLQYNRYKDAEPIINQCLTKYREWGSEDEFPYEYAKYYHKMSLVRIYQGDYTEAIKLGELSVQWMGKTGNNSLAYRFKFDLACIVTQSGEIQKALDMHKEIYQRRLSMCGRANEQTLQSRYAIGALYEILGEAEQAE
jgi:tetratricopeptide (TPR) repeat protein